MVTQLCPDPMDCSTPVCWYSAIIHGDHSVLKPLRSVVQNLAILILPFIFVSLAKQKFLESRNSYLHFIMNSPTMPSPHICTWFSSVRFSSVAQSCLTLCDPMNHSTPGLPVHHQLPEFTQTHVHWVGDAIQPSHPLSSPSPPARSPSQHQGLFQWVDSLHTVDIQKSLIDENWTYWISWKSSVVP